MHLPRPSTIERSSIDVVVPSVATGIRLIMIGVVPLSILMFEAVIFYSALRFAETMNFPKWAIPFVVGILGVLQDMTIDPAAVFDLHLVNGAMEGRWNWTSHYDKMFFGIPFLIVISGLS